MQKLIITLFFVIFNAEYFFTKIGFSSRILAILPELISIVAGVYVLLWFAIYKQIRIQKSYLILFGALILHIAIGLIGNQVQPLAILAGMRLYLKFIPFYFLPLICRQSDEQVRKQLKIILWFAILQCPLAFYQRIFEYNTRSGDYIAGTLQTAPMLTLFLLSTVSVIIAFYLKNKLSLSQFVILVITAFLPTAINETKATFILLPFAVLIPTMFGVSKDQRLKIFFTIIPALIVLTFGYTYLYSVFYGERADVLSFYTSDKMTDYMYKESDAKTIEGKEGDYGRVDSMLLAYKANSENLFRSVWGVGIGNAAKSFSKKLEGKYASEYLRLGGKGTGLSHLIWEIGLLGIIYVLCFLFHIFYDAFMLKDEKGIIGSFALGWLGVTVIATLTLPYQNIIAKDALVFTFLYFSGFLSASCYSVKTNAKKI